MEYRVLGPVEVLDERGRKLPLGGAMPQSVLASLLLRAGHTIALDLLIDELWKEPPATAARTVQSYVSRLRHELPKGAIESRPGGYRFVVEGEELDLEAFERRAEEGRAALDGGACEQAASLLQEALALWRGPALAGLTSEALRRQAERLEELHLNVLEDRLDADLGLARHGEIVPELQALVAEHPFRERFRAQLMRALYRSGRSRDALALYREGRRLLVEELGMEPGQELRELEQAILRQDAELEAPERTRTVPPAAPSPAEPEPPVAQIPAREVRKTVTVLFCDVVGSTALGEATDPEALRALLARYFDRMKSAVERHGGTVEKFIGDAVMAVFGVPAAHEDDALRACRAALEMRESLRELGLQGRLGITTGEVVTGTEERLATGSPVNLAARLQQAAQPGEILLGEPTLQVVAGAEVEALEPLALKGKEEPVEAYRLVAVHDATRRHEARFVGRAHELAAIREAWERALTEQRCELVTIVGEAGVGKSRLVAEALSSIVAPIVQGRCLSYGEGITYWPVVETLRQLLNFAAVKSAGRALDAGLSDPAATAALRSLLGDSETTTSAEEIAWAYRKLLEEQAPLIVVFDDVQWGEETFFDLVEHVALLAHGAAILLLCLARPELAERRREWPVVLRLEPLPEDDVDELIPEGFTGDLRGRITRKSGGNPLFVTEMVAMAAETEDEVRVPASLQALLAARIDQLDGGDRRVLERGAVEGEIFHRGTVQALSDGGPVTPRLASLVRKGLIRVDETQLPGDDAFRFRHLLIRDAAYDALPKATRADLHERFAAWLEQQGADVVDADEIIGFHLAQAARYRRELAPLDERAVALARRAAARLTSAGRRAPLRGDGPAAVALLSRAISLFPVDDPDRLPLLPDLGEALGDCGDYAKQIAVVDEAVQQAEAVGDRRTRSYGVLERGIARMHHDPMFTAEEGLNEAMDALQVFEDLDDERGQAHAWQIVAGYHMIRGHYGEAVEGHQQARAHAIEAGDERVQADAGLQIGTCLFYGDAPVDEVISYREGLLAQGTRTRGRSLEGLLAQAEAMRGHFDTARRLIAEQAGVQDSYGNPFWATLQRANLGVVEMLADQPKAAEEHLRRAYEALDEAGETSFRSTMAARLADALCTDGRTEEATQYTRISEETAAPDDYTSQILWRSVRAKAIASKRDQGKGERLARDAVALAEKTDDINLHADALMALGHVLRSGDRPGEVLPVLTDALRLYERKGNIVSADVARSARDDELRSDTVT